MPELQRWVLLPHWRNKLLELRQWFVFERRRKRLYKLRCRQVCRCRKLKL